MAASELILRVEITHTEGERDILVTDNEIPIFPTVAGRADR